VNDPWGEPDLISGATLNTKGMGLSFSRLNYRFAGLRLREALDGGADRRRCLPLCTGQGVGGGGGWGAVKTSWEPPRSQRSEAGTELVSALLARQLNVGHIHIHPLGAKGLLASDAPGAPNGPLVMG